MPERTKGDKQAAGAWQPVLEQDKVSVVIAAYNAAGYIGRCLESIFGQTYQNLQVIVVDDGSMDGTGDVVRSFGTQVEYIRLNRNRGPAYARTVGLQLSRGEFVAIIDADDYWLPDFIATTKLFLTAHPEAVAVSTAYYSRRWDGSTRQLPIPDADAAKFLSGAVIDDFFDFWSRRMHVLTGTVLMRTSVVQQTGGQREELRLTEDLEFWGYLATFGSWGFIHQHLFVTDETAISARERLKKISERYRLFCDISIYDWGKRIRQRVSLAKTVSFDAVVGRIGVAIAIANAYSGSYRRAWKLTCQFRKYLGPGLEKMLWAGLKSGRVLWPFFCMLIRVREHVIAYKPRLLRSAKFRAPDPLAEASKSKITVVFICSASPRPSDVNMNYFQRAHSLSRQTELTILAKRGADYSSVVEAGTTVPNSPWPGTVGQILHSFLYFLKRGKNRRPDIVITGPSILGVCGFAAKLLTGCRWVVDVWDIPIRVEQDRDIRKYIYFNLVRRLMKYVYRSADQFIISIIPDFELRYFDIPGERMLLLFNAINQKKSSHQLTVDSIARSDFSILCMRSAYTQQMGLDTLADAFALLKEAIPGLVLTIIGIIPSNVSGQVKELKGCAQIKFIDHIEHEKLVEMINNAAVCIIPFKDVPDLAQTYPIKVLEYLSQGRPVVASNIEGISRLIEHGVNGLLFRAGDAADLAEKVLLLYRDKHLRTSISSNATRYDERFDCQVKNDAIVKALHRLACSPLKGRFCERDLVA